MPTKELSLNTIKHGQIVHAELQTFWDREENKMVNKEFGKRLKEIRLINRLTQQQVADSLDINRSTYSYYEIGKTEPSIDTLHKLIKIFSITYDDLLPSSDDNKCSSLKELYLNSDNAFYNLSLAEQNVILHFRTLSNIEKIQYLEHLKS